MKKASYLQSPGGMLSSGQDEVLKKRQRAAAVKIQACWRGYLARKAYLRLQNATRKIQAHAKGWYTRKKVHEQRDRVARDAQFQATMARHRERIYALEAHKRLVLQQPSSNIEIWHEQRSRAAAKVQAAWRGYSQRRKLMDGEWDRSVRHQASKMQKEFKAIIAQAQTAHAKEMAASQQLSPGISRAAMPAALMQSATVLIGSPEKGVAAAVGGVAAAPDTLPRGAPVMSAKRYAALKKQVEARVVAHRAMAKHQRPDVHALDNRLKELLNAYHTTGPDRLQAAHSRAAQMVVLETLTATLDTGGLRPLASLVDPEPVDFPRPARGSERWERAMQAHACDLADARAGSQWWRHLRPLNHSQLQQALVQEDEIRWQGLDGLWRYQWARAADAEARRPDPLAKIRSRGTPPALANIADVDLCTSRDQGDPAAAAAAAARHTTRPGEAGVDRCTEASKPTRTEALSPAHHLATPPAVQQPSAPPARAVVEAEPPRVAAQVVQGLLGYYTVA